MKLQIAEESKRLYAIELILGMRIYQVTFSSLNFFEFTDVRGKTRKFQFEDQIHGHEVNVLKERIEMVQFL